MDRGLEIDIAVLIKSSNDDPIQMLASILKVQAQEQKVLVYCILKVRFVMASPIRRFAWCGPFCLVWTDSSHEGSLKHSHPKPGQMAIRSSNVLHFNLTTQHSS
jgi:hypothetical protein